MASNYTENYKLPLWEGNDNFVREEFNAANKTIDAALARVEGMASTAPVLLATAQLESEAHTLTMDVSHLDLSQYDELRLMIWGAGAESRQVCYMQINGVTDSQYFYKDLTGTKSYDGSRFPLGCLCTQEYGGGFCDCRIYSTGQTLFLSANAVAYNAGDVDEYAFRGVVLFCGFSTLSTLTFLHGAEEDSFAAGTKILLLGQKFSA